MTPAGHSHPTDTLYVYICSYKIDVGDKTIIVDVSGRTFLETRIYRYNIIIMTCTRCTECRNLCDRSPNDLRYNRTSLQTTAVHQWCKCRLPLCAGAHIRVRWPKKQWFGAPQDRSGQSEGWFGRGLGWCARDAVDRRGGAARGRAADARFAYYIRSRRALLSLATYCPCSVDWAKRGPRGRTRPPAHTRYARVIIIIFSVLNLSPIHRPHNGLNTTKNHTGVVREYLTFTVDVARNKKRPRKKSDGKTATTFSSLSPFVRSLPPTSRRDVAPRGANGLQPHPPNCRASHSHVVLLLLTWDFQIEKIINNYNVVMKIMYHT